jgi:NADPH:quinone reductase-like Zn-dependent oxidoreductase
MKAILVTTPGGISALEYGEIPDPKNEDDQVLVRVRSANINPTDIAARDGHVRGDAKPPYVLGWDFAGDIVEVGNSVDKFLVGDRVAGMIPWYDVAGRVGAYSTYIAVPTDWIVKISKVLDYDVAATIPLNGLTAYQSLELLNLNEGENILITGASGSVGGFAVELAKQQGLVVSAIASEGDEEWVNALGAAVVYSGRMIQPEFKQFRYVFDAAPIGDPLFDVLDDGAVIVTTRRVGSVKNLERLQIKAMGVKSNQKTLENLLKLAEGKLIHTRIASTFPLSEIQRAHTMAEQGKLRGKVLLHP